MKTLLGLLLIAASLKSWSVQLWEPDTDEFKKLALQCKNEICQNEAYPFTVPYISMSESDALAGKKIFDEKIKTPLSKILGSNERQLISIVKLLQSAKDVPEEQLQLNDTQKNYVNTLIMANYAQHFLDTGDFDFVRYIQTTPSKNHSITIEEIEEISKSFKFKDTDIYNDVKEDYLKITTLLSLKKNLAGILKTNAFRPRNYAHFIHSQLDLNEAIKKEVALQKEYFKKLYEISPLYRFFNMQKFIWNKVDAHIPLLDDEIIFLFDAAFERRIGELIFQATLKLNKLKYVFTKPVEFKVKNSFNFALKSFTELQNVDHPGADFKNLYQSTIDLCSMNASYSYLAYPTESELQNFRQLVLPDLKMAAQKALSELIPDSDKNFIQNIQIATPLTKELAIKTWTNDIELMTQNKDLNEKEFLQKIKEKPTATEIHMLGLMISSYHYLLQKNDIQELNPLFKSISFCMKARDGFIDDATLSNFKNIHASSPTVKSIKYGPQILAHEMGHVVYYKYASQLPQLLSCLKEKDLSEEKIRTNEDFSDVFSIKVMKNYYSQKKINTYGNMGCALNIPGKEASQLTLADQNSNDVHSTSFYRLLAFEAMFNNGQIPLKNQSCHELIKLKNELRFNNICK